MRRRRLNKYREIPKPGRFFYRILDPMYRIKSFLAALQIKYGILFNLTMKKAQEPMLRREKIDGSWQTRKNQTSKKA